MLQTHICRRTRYFLWKSGCLLVWLRIMQGKLHFLDKMLCLGLDFFPSPSVSWDVLAAGKIMCVTAVSATLSKRAWEWSHPHHSNNLNLFLRHQHLHPVSAWMTAQSLQMHQKWSWYTMRSQLGWQIFIKFSIASYFSRPVFNHFYFSVYVCIIYTW